MKAEIEIVADAQELSHRAAAEFVRLAREAVDHKGVFSAALAGGSTPKSLYGLLSNEEEPYRTQLPWNNIHFFWGDERHVPPDHVESNYRMAHEEMLAKVAVPLDNVHRIKSESADACKAADDYEMTLREYFNLAQGQLPRFDLVLLGMGADGHTASIFPGSEVIDEESRFVMALWVKQVDSYRITLTPPVINNAACVIFLVSGTHKAETLRNVLQTNYQPKLLPAQLVKPMDGRLLWLVDRAAARLLELN